MNIPVTPKYQNSWIRNIVFPYYSYGQILFTILIVIMLTLIMYMLNPDLQMVCTLGGYFGASIIARMNAPAWINISDRQYTAVIVSLRRSKFVLDQPIQSWHAPLPAWLRWPHSQIVVVENQDKSITLRGPMMFLTRLSARLNVDYESRAAAVVR